MKNRSFPPFEESDRAPRPALTKPILATPCLALLEDKSLMDRPCRLINLGETERATAHLPAVFAELYCKLERLCAEKVAQTARRRTLTISWEKTDNRLSDVNVNVKSGATRKSSSGKEGSATEHTSSPPVAACSHARPRPSRGEPCD